MRKFVISLLIASAAIVAPIQLAHATQSSEPQTVRIVPVDANDTGAAGAAEVIRESRLFAESLGEGLVTVATKMGIAVQEFANSPTGKIVTFFLFLKFFGGLILKILLIPVIGGYGIWFVRKGISALQRDRVMPASVEFIPRTGLLGWFGLNEKRVSKWKEVENDEGSAIIPILIGMAMIGISSILLASL